MPTHRVVALAHPPQCLLNHVLVAEVFKPGGRGNTSGWYEFLTCGISHGTVSFGTDWSITVNHGISALHTADTIVVPGWDTRDQPAPSAIVDGLRDAHARGTRILALGTGAFLLATAGLLAGRRATTHWDFATDLAARYPQVKVDANVLYIDHGDIATSAGMAAGIDLCLHIVRADHGAAAATDIAYRMVAPPLRDGGQAQSARVAPLQSATTSLGPVLDWAIANLDKSLYVRTLASRALMSPRTFVRRFLEEIGESPGQWVITQRVNAARELLERTNLPVETIAGQVGLYSAANLRRHFQRFLNTTPAEYRNTFQGGSHLHS